MPTHESSETLEVVVDGTGESHFHVPTPLALRTLANVYACGHNEYGSRTRVRRSFHTGHLVLCVTRGRMWLEVGRHRFDLRRGQVAWFDLGQPHAYGTDGGGSTVTWARVGGAPVAQLFTAARAEAQPVFSLDAAVFDAVKSGLSNLLHTMRRPTDDFEPRAGQIVYQLLSALVASRWREGASHSSEPASLNREVQRLVKFIEEHACERISLDQLTKMAHWSRYHLSRRFSQITGYSIPQYINACRVARARELLEQTDLTVTEIAGRVGFSDSSYFASCFNKVVGCTPTAYRRSRLEGPVHPSSVHPS